MSLSVVRTGEDVAAHVDAAIGYGDPGTVGAELEWLVVDRATPRVRPPLVRVARALPEVLPGGSVVTTEPGGQVELSSLPHPGPAAAVDALSADVASVRAALAGDALVLTGLGTDPLRPPVRLVDSARYAVMEAHYRRVGGACASAGRAMMCSSAAVQVSLDAGTRTGGVQSAGARWRRAHAVGPALVAAFACSPLLEGRPTGWASTRQRFWSDIDPTRTVAPDPTLGPVEALTRLALDARLMIVRDAEGVCRPAPPGLRFRDWLTAGSPTTDDLDYHLTTLFPPVRLRGWYELRYLDALPDPLWRVAVGVAAALLDDDRAAEQAQACCEPVADRWLDAARLATADPALAAAAAGCLQAAVQALPRMGAPGLAAETACYLERFTLRSRCPADDLLEAHRAGMPAEALLLGQAPVAA